MRTPININLDIEKLPEGRYVATSGDVQGLVAQGKTFEEVVEIAEDVAKVLLRARGDNSRRKKSDRIFYPMRINV